MSDYTGREGTLEALEKKVAPLLTNDGSHPGKLTKIRKDLNPGNHDDEVPSMAALRVTHGNLRQLSSDYL